MHLRGGDAGARGQLEVAPLEPRMAAAGCLGAFDDGEEGGDPVAALCAQLRDAREQSLLGDEAIAKCAIEHGGQPCGFLGPGEVDDRARRVGHGEAVDKDPVKQRQVVGGVDDESRPAGVATARKCYVEGWFDLTERVETMHGCSRRVRKPRRWFDVQQVRSCIVDFRCRGDGAAEGSCAEPIEEAARDPASKHVGRYPGLMSLFDEKGSVLTACNGRKAGLVGHAFPGYRPSQPLATCTALRQNFGLPRPGSDPTAFT